jgi:hypothetical protein
MIPSLSSGETNQDSEPILAVNPANALEMAATAFTPSPNVGSSNSPIYYSNDGGNTWALKDIIAGTPVRDQTLRFCSTSGTLYAGVLWGGGSNIALINFDILRTNDFSGLSTMTVLASRKKRTTSRSFRRPRYRRAPVRGRTESTLAATITHPRTSRQRL